MRPAAMHAAARTFGPLREGGVYPLLARRGAHVHNLGAWHQGSLRRSERRAGQRRAPSAAAAGAAHQHRGSALRGGASAEARAEGSPEARAYDSRERMRYSARRARTVTTLGARCGGRKGGGMPGGRPYGGYPGCVGALSGTLRRISTPCTQAARIATRGARTGPCCGKP